MSTENNTDKLTLPIEVLEFDKRTYNTLRRGNVTTLLDIVNLGEIGLLKIYRLGNKQIPYILSKLDDFLSKSPEVIIADIQSKTTLPPKVSLDDFSKGSVSLSQAFPYDPRPFLYTVATSETPNLVQITVPFIKVLFNKLQYQRYYEILRRRYGFENTKVYKLQELGDYFGITREGVRQIAERAKLKIHQTLIGKFDTKKWRMPLNIVTEAKEFFNFFQNYAFLITEPEAVNLIQKRYGNKITNEEMGTIRLLLSLSGLEVLPKFPQEAAGISLIASWASLEKIDRSLLFRVVDVVYHILLNEVKPVSKFDILVQVNKKLKKKVEQTFFDHAIKICREIEQTDDDSFEFRFESLPSVADKAYRILYNADESMHVRQIAILLNKEAFKHGETSKVTPHHMGARLSSDSRFASIGRSGKWFLVEWEGFSAEFILDLMANALHSVGEPLSAKAIYDFVRQKRPVEKKVIDSYLSQDNRFVRVGVEQFALRDWGLASVSTSRTRNAHRVFSKAKLCEYIEVVFKSKQVGEMFLVDLSQEISKLEPKVSSQSIYILIIKSPAVKIVDQQMERKRKVAIFVPNYRTKLTKLDILTRDILVGELIQSTIRKVLENQPKNQLELASVRDLVSKELTCPPSSVYSALEKMDDVEKIRNNSNQMTCRLVKSVNNYDEQIDKIADKQLVSEISRAVNLANIDSIDLALFQIGKIFEHTLKKYMLEVQTRNLLPVTADDISKLYKMVQWAGKTGLVTDETALQYLRIERNGRAHGAPAARDEREALLKLAPALIPIYLDYVVLLENRRANLK